MRKTLLVQQTSRETVGEPVIVVLAVLLIEGNRKVITVSGKIYVLSIIVHYMKCCTQWSYQVVLTQGSHMPEYL